MNVYMYKTLGGKNLIIEFINSLSSKERAEGFVILEILENGTLEDLQKLDIKHFSGKVWEIKFRKFNRLFYVLRNNDSIYLLHGCKKQKNSTETKDKDLALMRAKEVA